VLGGEGRGAQEEQRVVGRPDAAVQHHLAARERHTGAEPGQLGTARSDPGRTLDDRVDAPPGQPGDVGDPAPRAAHVRLGGPLVGQPEPLGQLRPRLRGDPVGGPPGDRLHVVADVQQVLATRLEVGVRHVDEPCRDQRVEDGGVAQPAGRLLHVRDAGVRELAEQVVALVCQPAQLRQPPAGVPAPVGEHRGAEPEGEVRVAGEVADVQQAERHPDVAVRGGDHLGQRPQRVVEVRPRVPERVPQRRRGPAELDAVVVHQHDVEVGVRRQLTAAVAADRDERRPLRGARRGGVRLDAEPVGGGRPLGALGRCHPLVPAVVRSRRRRGRRSGPGRRSRWP